ncbi:hypothetical protein IBA8401_28200 [Pseudomonas syringae]
MLLFVAKFAPQQFARIIRNLPQPLLQLLTPLAGHGAVGGLKRRAGGLFVVCRLAEVAWPLLSGGRLSLVPG